MVIGVVMSAVNSIADLYISVLFVVLEKGRLSALVYMSVLRLVVEYCFVFVRVSRDS